MNFILPSMDWAARDLVSALRMFRQHCDLHFSVNHVQPQHQVSDILPYAGHHGRNMYDSWGLPADKAHDPEVVWARFQSQLKCHNATFRHARLYLHQLRQQEGESFEEFVERCRLQASKCELSDEECNTRVLEQIIGGNRHPQLQTLLLQRDNTLTVHQALDMARDFEASIRA